MIKVYKNENVNVCSSYALPYDSELIERAKQSQEVKTAKFDDIAQAASYNNETPVTNATIIDQAKENAKKIIDDAIREAENICAKAHIEAQEIFENQRKSGYTEGYNAGEGEAKRIICEQLELVEQFNGVLQTEFEQIKHDCWENVKLLAIQVAQKVVGELLPINDVVIGALKNAAINIPKTEKIKVIMSEKEYRFAVKNIDLVKNLFQGTPSVDIIKDSQFDENKMVIITTDCEVDVSLNKQFDTISSVFSQI